MSDLIERYVHQVGRYLPQKERADIQAELRSQIQDQLDDRFQGAPGEADVVTVLAELGDPRRMAASYGGEQYLIGPDLYPVMMMVLRRGWVIVPPIAIFVHVLARLLGDDSGNLINLLLEAVGGAFQAAAIFTGIVVLIFAIMQHSGEDLSEITGENQPFDPRSLPAVNDPAQIDRAEAVFGIAFGTFAVLVLLYFLRVGGLTLRFNLSDPGEVIPVPVAWLVALIVIVAMQVVLQLTALLRGRWNVPMWLLNVALDLIGAVALYFVLWMPLLAGLLSRVPALSNIPFIERAPAILVGIGMVITLIEGLVKLVKMLIGQDGAEPVYRPKASG